MISQHAELLVMEARSFLADVDCWEHIEEDLKRARKSPPDERDAWFIAAPFEGLLAGCVAVVKLTKDECEMRYLYVRQGVRGCKLGQVLVYSALREAEGAHFSRVIAKVPHKCIHAAQLLTNLDFEVVGEDEGLSRLQSLLSRFLEDGFGSDLIKS